MDRFVCKSFLITKVKQQLKSVHGKNFSFTIYRMSVVSNVSNLARQGDNVVNMW